MDAYRAEQKADREEQKRRLEEQKKLLGAEALTKFGFQMAANASTPGATLLGSAGKAAPAIGDVYEQGRKLEAASLENMAKLKRDDAQFNMAVKRNDMKSALDYANVMRQDKKDQQMIELERQKLAQMASYYSQAGSTSLQKIADDLMRADPSLDRKTAFYEASKISGFSFRSDASNELNRAKLIEQIRQKDVNYRIAELQKLAAKTPEEAAKYDAILQQKEKDFISRVPGAGGASTIPEGVTIKKTGS